jgi:hypothetical protein
LATGLDELIADAQQMPAAILPRPRRPVPAPRTIDLTAAELRIPETAMSLVDGYAEYGA